MINNKVSPTVEVIPDEEIEKDNFIKDEVIEYVVFNKYLYSQENNPLKKTEPR